MPVESHPSDQNRKRSVWNKNIFGDSGKNHETVANNEKTRQRGGHTLAEKWNQSLIGRLANHFVKNLPKPWDFISIYGEEDINLDAKFLKEVKDQQQQPNQNSLGMKPSKKMEFLFLYQVANSDWFEEGTQYAGVNAEGKPKDPNYRPFRSSQTAEPDDWFGHIDEICAFTNQHTKGESVPFAIDFTSNIHQEDIAKKMGWLHRYGRRDPERTRGRSEYNLRRSEKYGLFIPGFASAKYSIDKNHKGRIKVMPRIVAGYSEKLLGPLNNHPLKKDNLTDDDLRRINEFDVANFRAKWCVLLEGYQQAKCNKMRLERLTNREIASMDKEDLRTACERNDLMLKHFENAIIIAQNRATSKNPEIYNSRRAKLEREGMDYATKLKDPVLRTILGETNKQMQELERKPVNPLMQKF